VGKHGLNDVVGKSGRTLRSVVQHSFHTVSATVEVVGNRPKHRIEQEEAAKSDTSEHAPSACALHGVIAYERALERIAGTA
jgi:hypothetical protein